MKWFCVGIIVCVLFVMCMCMCFGVEYNVWGCGVVWVMMEEVYRESCIFVVFVVVGVEYLKWGVVYDEIDVMYYI